ncbi:MAG: TonB-dependent receptor [Chromatiales bacterium]|nr:TonB-dependent receptor [Chromatiales bacterium]
MDKFPQTPAGPVGARGLATAVAAALGSLPAQVVLAQPVMLEEIVVTATRRTETLQQVPFNIAALSSQDIARQRLSSLGDALRLVPGVHLVDQGGRDGNPVVARGLNASALTASEFTGNSAGESLSTYMGDIPFYMDLRLLDIERVEVLLGPQGTLYGAGTLGGAIRYIPSRPDLSASSLSLSGDIYGYSQSSGVGGDVSAVLNLPLIAERLALRAAVGYYDAPGFIDYNFLVSEPGISNPQPDFSDPADVAANLRSKRNANTEETLAARAGLRWVPLDFVTADLTWYYQRQKVGARQINHRDAFGTGRYESAHRFLEPNDRENHLLALEVVLDLGFATLTSATGYGQYDEVGQRDQTDLLLDFEFGYEAFPAFAAFTREDFEEKTVTQELRLVSNDDGPLNWIVGAFYNRFEVDALSLEFVPGIPDFFGIDRPDEVEYYQLTEITRREQALFGELGYDLTDRWAATLGMRWYGYRIDQNVGFDLPLLFGLTEGFDPVFTQNSVRDNGTLFKFSTSYAFSDEYFGYLTVSEGYRVGGVNPIRPCAPDEPPETQAVCAAPGEEGFSPDQTTNVEVGLRVQSADRRLSGTAALYFIDWDDIQVAGRTEAGSVPITVNRSRARSRGIELSVDALLTDQLRLLANYTLTSARLTADSPVLVPGGEPPEFSGDRLPGSPRHRGSLVLNWSQPLVNDLLLEADYRLSAQSDVYTTPGLRNNGEALSGFALHGIALGVSSSQWSTRLYVDNLFNTYGETGVRGDPSFIRDVNGFDLRRYYKVVTPPRRVGLEFSYRFDF